MILEISPAQSGRPVHYLDQLLFKSHVAMGLKFFKNNPMANGRSFIRYGIKTTFDGMSTQGKTYHIESTGKWDGNDAPVTGDPNAEAFAIRKIDTHTMEFVVKKRPGNKPEPWRVTVSKDGKTMTSVGVVKRATGQEISGTYVYDRQ